ncbi:hypothetical protein HK105_201396 [Polyrhizophydium stewartii]|uniref:Ankyrin repeat protein n=1 Tax=Polyrhizophydium stewartii TaxID=2732419 RepID=A0ABR4NHW5_9FUNG|nr:hypothetical protein HK105_001037 [Polyrhizophydium stewartii]
METPARNRSDALPFGASYWDRLAQELKDMSIDRSSPFTRLLAGRLSGAALSALPPAQKLQLWSEVVEHDWQGDMTELPVPDDVPSQLFWGLRSRPMYDRIKARGAGALHKALQHAAARNGWFEEVDMSNPDWPGWLAAESGSLDLLVDVVERRKLKDYRPSIARCAARFGHVHILEHIHSRARPYRWADGVTGAAAASGHLGVVRFMLEEVSDPLLPTDIDQAAKGGNLEIVKYLRDRWDAHTTTRALDGAAEAGHLETLEYLHALGEATCSAAAVDGAAANGHMQVLRWLKRHSDCQPSASAMDAAIRRGHFEAGEFLYANYGLGFTEMHYYSVACAGRLDLVKLIHDAVPGISSASAMAGAASKGHWQVVLHILNHFGQECTEDVVAAAAALGDIAMLELLVARGHGGLIGSNTMDAAGGADVETLEWVRRHSTAPFTRAALSSACWADKTECAAWLLSNVDGVEWWFSECRDMQTWNDAFSYVEEYAVERGLLPEDW